MSDESPDETLVSGAQLGSVPLKQDVRSSGATVPNVDRSPEPARALPPTPPPRDTIAPAPTANRSIPMVVGLTLAVAGLGALAGLQFVSGKERQERLEEASARASELEQAKRGIESERDQFRNNTEEANNRLNNELVVSETTINELRQKLQARDQELDKALAEIRGLKSKVNLNEPSIGNSPNSSSELNKLQASNAKLAAENASLKENLERLESNAPQRPSSISSNPGNPSHLAKNIQPAGESPNPKKELTSSPRSSGRAWTRLGTFKTGESKGKWYYVAPDGYQSPLYRSREEAIYEAELRLAHQKSTYTSSAVLKLFR